MINIFVLILILIITSRYIFLEDKKGILKIPFIIVKYIITEGTLYLLTNLILVFIILFIILIIINLVSYYKLFAKIPGKLKLLDKKADGRTEKKLKDKLSVTDVGLGKQFVINMVLFIENLAYRYNEKKVILDWSDNNSEGIKIILMDKIGIGIQFYRYSKNTLKKTYIISTDYNIPLQTENKITFVLDNQSISIFINNKLVQSDYIDFVYEYGNSPMVISPKYKNEEYNGFMGYYKKIEYIPQAISLEQIKNL